MDRQEACSRDGPTQHKKSPGAVTSNQGQNKKNKQGNNVNFDTARQEENMADFRIDVGFFNHIKTKRLRKRLGLEGVFALQMLWAYAAQHEHEHGRVYTNEDIELAVDWDGDDLAPVLAEVGYLDAVDGGYIIHELETHNGYAASAAKRSAGVKC